MRRSTRITTIFCYLCTIESVFGGIAPAIPAQGRAEYYLLQNDGSYNYGYDTGNGIYAKQTGSKDNEVQGSYTYNSNGELINVKYTSGVQGFMPELPGGLKVVPLAAPLTPVLQANTGLNNIVVESVRTASPDENNGDKTYSFAYQSDNHERQESSDGAGFVKGRYSYTDETGTHNLEYKAGPDTGFEVIGGSLAQPNGLLGKQSSSSSKTWTQQTAVPAVVLTKSSENDGSYSFEYNAGDSSRQENADANGNVRGRYWYKNEAGNHDLSYIAGADTGFQVTGGSLAAANGLSDEYNARLALSKTVPASKASWSVAEAHKAYIEPQAGLAVKTSFDEGQNNDGSYSFEYHTGDSSRKESADAGGNVRGSYSFTNEAGNHDLSYIAGADTGFLVTGGSLAQPNGLSEEFNLRSAEKWRSTEHQKMLTQSGPSSAVLVKTPVNPANDGSFSFEYDAGDSSRKESGDAGGNIRGSYTFSNEAGNHDLSYVAGADTGFQVTGGSLATANGLSDAFNAKSAAAWRSKPMTKSHVQQLPLSSGHSVSEGNTDGSYSFEYQTNDQSRKESADANGNVRGRYSYMNEAGNHDLTYVAGPNTGFLVTGGSLAKTTELTKSAAPSPATKFTQKSHATHHGTTTTIHGSGHAEQPIAGRSILLKTSSGSIGTKWLPVPENYKSGYYFQTTH